MKRVLVGFLALIMLSSCTQMFIDLSKPLENIFGKVNAPEFSLEEGCFDETTDVTITTETKGATIYWTDDGSTPSKNTHTGSGKERVTIALNKTCAMKAIALKEGYMNSLVVEKKYKMAVLTPTITQNGRNIFTIATTTTGATLYYTLDGSAPSETNNAGSGIGNITFNLDPGTKTIKALGIKTGYENSDLKEWSGTILKELPQLVILGDNSTDLTNASSLSFGTVIPNASKDITLTIKNNAWNSLNLTGSSKV